MVQSNSHPLGCRVKNPRGGGWWHGIGRVIRSKNPGGGRACWGGGVVKTVVPTVCIFLVKECDLVGGEIEAAHTKLTHLQHKEKN